MTPPRTAMVALWFPKPSETFVVAEAKALRDAGVPLSAFSLYGRLPGGEALKPEGVAVEHLGLAGLPRILWAFCLSLLTRPLLTLALLGRTLFSPGGGWEKYGENLLSVFCGFALARRFRALGVGHAHAAWANGSATAAWCAARLCGIPFSLSARARDVLPPDGLLARKLRDAAFARVESSYIAPILTARIPDAPEKVHLIYDACAMTPGPEAPAPMQPPLKLVAVGRFVKKKGFGHLIKALALLKDRGVAARLTLAGDGPLRRELEDQAARLGVGDRVEFPGFVPYARVPEFLSRADMLVMPSVRTPDGDSDGLPTVLIEALLHRLPVVATRLAGIPDLVIHGETGLLTPEADPEALAGAIAQTGADRARALRMAARGREMALVMFAPENYARAMLPLLARGA